MLIAGSWPSEGVTREYRRLHSLACNYNHFMLFTLQAASSVRTGHLFCDTPSSCLKGRSTENNVTVCWPDSSGHGRGGVRQSRMNGGTCIFYVWRLVQGEMEDIRCIVMALMKPAVKTHWGKVCMLPAWEDHPPVTGKHARNPCQKSRHICIKPNPRNSGRQCPCL